MKLTPWMLTVATFTIVSTLAMGYLLKLAFGREPAPEPQRASRTLPMAVSGIEPGTVITRAHLGNGPWDRTQKLEPDTLTNIDTIVGRIAKAQIASATPLTGSMFYALGDFPEIEVEDGKRAVVVQVSPTTAALNMKLKKGQYVDVELTVDNVDLSSPSRRRNSNNRRPNMSSSDAMTATLFKGVKVLEINKSPINSSIQNAASPSQSVTLELDEEQSRIALLAQKKGEIDLIYSNNGPGTGGISIEAREEDRIFFMEILGLRLQEEKQPFEAEHYRGQSFSNTFFEDGRRLNTGTSGGSGNRLSPGGGGRRSSSTDDGLTIDDLAGSPPDTETDMAVTPASGAQAPN